MTDDDNKTPLDLMSFGTGLRAVIVGASGGIGAALAQELESCRAVSDVIRLSRSATGPANAGAGRLSLDLENEDSIAEAASRLRQTAGDVHLVIVATGILHAGDAVQPEKSWRAIAGPAMESVFRHNAIGPVLVAKHFLPMLARDRKTAFAALSARVGSIEDNQLGGWYAYRASKAALNMLIKTLSIELARSHPMALCVGLHPGTVDTGLSKPFQSGVPREKLFPPARSARHLLTVLDGLGPEDSGGLLAWDGQRIPY